MASFQAKIGWKMPRKREYKKYHSVSFLPNAKQKIPKKFKNLKNAIMASFQAKEDGKCREREKIKIIGPFRSYTTCNRKFQKNSKKIQKTKKIPFWLHFKQKQVGKG